MKYNYMIFKEVYNYMLSGKKTVEFRLLNEKSSSIQIGDFIKFTVLDNEKKYLITEVIDIYIYNNLDELWDTPDVLSHFLNYTKEEFIEAFNNIFGENNVKKSKIVGFKIKIIT